MGEASEFCRHHLAFLGECKDEGTFFIIGWAAGLCDALANLSGPPLPRTRSAHPTLFRLLEPTTF